MSGVIHVGMRLVLLTPQKFAFDCRLKQLTGVAELFRRVDYSLAWEMEEDAGSEPASSA
jgi:hypothetical protein